MDGFFMEHPIFFDDLGVPLFLETSMGFHVKFYQKLLLFWGGQIFTPFRAGFWGRAQYLFTTKASWKNATPNLYPWKSGSKTIDSFII